MSQNIEKNQDWGQNLPVLNQDALSGEEKSIVIYIPLESWSFKSFDYIGNFGISISASFLEKGKIPPLPMPSQNNISFPSLLAPPIESSKLESAGRLSKVHQRQIDKKAGGRRVNKSEETSDNPASRRQEAGGVTRSSQLLTATSSELETLTELSNEKGNLLPQTSASDLIEAEIDKTSSALATYYRELGLLNSLPPKNRSYLDKFFLAIACFYSLAIFVCLGSKFNLNFARLLMPQATKVAVDSPVSDPDAQFMSYMQRSLKAIERKAQIKEKQTPSTDSSDDSATEPSPKAIEFNPDRSNKNNMATVPAPWQTGMAMPIGAGLSNNLPLAQLPTLSPPPPPPPLPTPVKPKKSANLPPPPAIGQIESIPTTTTETQAQSAPISSVKPTIAGYTLIGLLDLGERSAALFETNETTSQIWAGEEIGNTGWTLKAVTPRSVKITRQGESRSLSVGEKF
jgi:hypothetical protein